MVHALLSAAVLIGQALVIVAILLRERREPGATLAWLLAVCFVPVAGLVLYFLFGTLRARRLARRSGLDRPRLEALLEPHAVRRETGSAGGNGLDERTASLVGLSARISTTPASAGNSSTLLVDAAATYRSMLQAIESATDHIHVEFYIVQPDRTGTSLRDRLARRAREGVEVRVLVDGVGSMGLPRGFWAPLRQAGGEAAVFRPVTRTLRWIHRRDRIDFRNHRKIVIADGRVGFTGGINVGREYLGLDPEMGRWRDTHLRLEGPAVLGLQQAFADDWLLATNAPIAGERYFPKPGTPGDDIVQIIDSGPDRRWSAIGLVYLQAFALARRRIWITNPYFIPTAPIEAGLVAAALRGVDVHLLLPARSDSQLVRLASASHYRALLEAGVRIHEYERGFVHAKTMVVDDWLATVGSANLDMRSFHLNWELNAFVHGATFARELGRQFELDLGHARAVDPERERRRPLPLRLLRAGARLLSPLL